MSEEEKEKLKWINELSESISRLAVVVMGEIKHRKDIKASLDHILKAIEHSAKGLKNITDAVNMLEKRVKKLEGSFATLTKVKEKKNRPSYYV